MVSLHNYIKYADLLSQVGLIREGNEEQIPLYEQLFRVLLQGFEYAFAALIQCL